MAKIWLWLLLLKSWLVYEVWGTIIFSWINHLSKSKCFWMYFRKLLKNLFCRSRSPSTASSSMGQDSNNDDGQVKLSIETLEELDWCLEQLETMQTHRSVSDMASSKVGQYQFSCSKCWLKNAHSRPQICCPPCINRTCEGIILSSYVTCTLITELMAGKISCHTRHLPILHFLKNSSSIRVFVAFFGLAPLYLSCMRAHINHRFKLCSGSKIEWYYAYRVWELFILISQR